MKKILIIILISFGVLLGACSSGINQNTQTESSSSKSNNEVQESIQDNEATTNIEDSTNSQEKPKQDSGTTKEINVIAKQWKFEPNSIEVNLNDKVILHIKSVDVTHGIAIPDFGISKQLSPGSEETIEFVANKKGTFSFFCNVYCGQGHKDMKGELIVN